MDQAPSGAQVAKAEAEIREQGSRLAEMKTLQTEVESLRERLRAAQQQCSALEATASLVPALKSQVSVLTKQVPPASFNQGSSNPFHDRHGCGLSWLHPHMPNDGSSRLCEPCMHGCRLRKQST